MRKSIDKVLVGYEHFSTEYRSTDRQALQEEAQQWSKSHNLSIYCMMDQVHGDVILPARRNEVLPQCDGLISDDKKMTLLGTFADCVPIAFWDEHGNLGLCHAGWKGTALRIAPKMLDLMHQSFGSRHIQGWIGPCICTKHYEVSPDFDQFCKPFSERSFFRIQGKAYFDLVEENRAQLEAHVFFHQLHLDNACTFENINYHSHRRSGVARGRNVAYITAKSED